MNITYEIVDNINMNDLIHIWRIISKFKEKKINLFVFFRNNFNHFYVTSLLNKIDWMIQKQNYDIEIKIVTKIEYESIEKWFSLYNINSNNVLYSSDKLFLTAQYLSEEELSKLMIDSKNTNFIGDMYVIINDNSDINNFTKMKPKIWVFSENMKEDSYYNGWMNQIKEKYISGEELFL
jgi:hypothetical protein